MYAHAFSLSLAQAVKALRTKSEAQSGSGSMPNVYSTWGNSNQPKCFKFIYFITEFGYSNCRTPNVSTAHAKLICISMSILLPS